LNSENHSIFHVQIYFTCVVFQNKEMVHMTLNKSKKYMNNTIFDFFVLKIFNIQIKLGMAE